MGTLKSIIKGVAVGIAVAAALDLVFNTFSKNDKLISREGSAILSNPKDKKMMDDAIIEALKSPSKKAVFIKSNGESVSIVI